MLSLPRQQALKALRGSSHNTLHHLVRGPLRDPPRSPLPNHFRNPPLIRHVHNGSVPFSGPPSYATIIRRFSSEPNPRDFFAEKKAMEAIERREFIDIHDVGGVEPEDYDVLITDVSEKTLRTEIAQLLNVKYLQKATKDEADNEIDIATAIIYGTKFRVVFPCAVSFEGNAYWVFFIVDTGAPLTYLSTRTAELLGLGEGEAPLVTRVAGYPHTVHISPKDSHFSDINILGNDFIRAHNIGLVTNRKHGKVDMFFNVGTKWEMPKPKL